MFDWILTNIIICWFQSSTNVLFKLFALPSCVTFHPLVNFVSYIPHSYVHISRNASVKIWMETSLQIFYPVFSSCRYIYLKVMNWWKIFYPTFCGRNQSPHLNCSIWKNRSKDKLKIRLVHFDWRAYIRVLVLREISWGLEINHHHSLHIWIYEFYNLLFLNRNII